ncbi:hypothetical protein ACJ73_04088 [Blastomyces percursus]|uniref:Uncharacterized protein n=1 Tax=Blastomyces percursus TaxID=1658174 RepID=A0A1J9R997_9EURO|nr:hypothetical protein ACJ73_04088 [Blastomyces percursus]
MAAKRKGKPPRQHSAASRSDVRNVTDPMPGQTEWSVDNLPEILYVFRPTAPQARSLSNLPTKPSPWGSGPDLRIFDILPDRISANVEEFRVEAWMRLDRRIQLHDITDRMYPDFRIANNALQQRGVRFRQAFNILSWGTGNKKTKVVAEQLEKKMQAKGIDTSLNSTRGLTPGLVNLAMGEAGGRIPVPEAHRQRFNAFAKEQDELIRQLTTMEMPVMLSDTARTQGPQQLSIVPSVALQYGTMGNDAQLECDDSEMEDIYNSGGCEGEHESGSIWEEKKGDSWEVPLHGDCYPRIHSYDERFEGAGPTTPTGVQVSRVPIELLMEWYIDIPYCWKLDMFKTMDKIQAVIHPTHSNDILQGQIVADEWQLFPIISDPPCDYLDFSDLGDVPAEYEMMEKAMKYQREYGIDIDYCEQLRDSDGQNSI